MKEVKGTIVNIANMLPEKKLENRLIAKTKNMNLRMK